MERFGTALERVFFTSGKGVFDDARDDGGNTFEIPMYLAARDFGGVFPQPAKICRKSLYNIILPVVTDVDRVFIGNFHKREFSTS